MGYEFATPEDLELLGVGGSRGKPSGVAPEQDLPTELLDGLCEAKPVETAPAQTSEYNALAFDNALDFLVWLFPEYRLYKWQCETLMQLSGYVTPGDYDNKVTFTADAPCRYNMLAANGSGKDAFVIAGYAVFFAACKIRSRFIVTSSSHTQLKGQTFPHITNIAERLNKKLGRKFFDVVEYHVRSRESGSEIKGFATDDAGKAEGFHPWPDSPGQDMVICINEAKSIPAPLWDALQRCHGFNVWMEISSPGTADGHFYQQCQKSTQWPAPLVPGIPYMRRITAFDCPHLKFRIKQMIEDLGETAPVVRSSLFAEFVALEGMYFVPSHILENYPRVEPAHYGLPIRAGLDLSLGGDETVLSVWHGNKRIGQMTWKMRDSNVLHRHLIDAFKRFGVLPQHVWADAGGLGKPIIDRLREAGYAVNSVINNGTAADKRYFKNRGTELIHNFAKLVNDRILILPGEDQVFMRQLARRRFSIDDSQKFQAESKDDARLRGEESPDRFDAAVLAFTGLTAEYFLRQAGPETPKTEEELRAERMKQFQLEYNAYYGHAQQIHHRVDRFNPASLYARREAGQAGLNTDRLMGRRRGPRFSYRMRS